uniref:Uncharacterized protein n=1 Tax=Anguilla anguilla TaxID=7936 RepID=A0A0E9PE85_ANGAN
MVPVYMFRHLTGAPVHNELLNVHAYRFRQ